MRTSIRGRTLVIEIDLDGTQGITQNGNVKIASTNGWATIEPKTSLTLTVVKRA